MVVLLSIEYLYDELLRMKIHDLKA